MDNNDINIAEEIAYQMGEFDILESDARENVTDMLGITYSETFDIEDAQRMEG